MANRLGGRISAGPFGAVFSPESDRETGLKQQFGFNRGRACRSLRVLSRQWPGRPPGQARCQRLFDGLNRDLRIL